MLFASAEMVRITSESRVPAELLPDPIAVPSGIVMVLPSRVPTALVPEATKSVMVTVEPLTAIVIVALGAKVRKAYRNTTFMIHQVSGLSFGSLREMEDSVAEASRINEMLFNIIKSKTHVTEEQLNEVLQMKRDWFLTADEALKLGILTEIL